MPGQGPKPVTSPSPSTSDGDELDENEVKKIEEDLKEVKRRHKIVKREFAARAAALTAITAAVEQESASHAGQLARWGALLQELASRGAVIPADILDPLINACTALAESLRQNADTLPRLLPMSPISVDSADDDCEHTNETLAPSRSPVASPPAPEPASAGMRIPRY